MSLALLFGALIALALWIAAALGAPRPPNVSQLAAAAARSESRAATVAQSFGGERERAPDVPSTWTVRIQNERGTLQFLMGTAALWGTLFHPRSLDWMVLRAPGNPALAAGVVVRPPFLSVHDWRDGSPGERATHTTRSGVSLVIERPDGVELDDRAVLAWVEALPSGVTLVRLDRERVELRAQGALVVDPLSAARTLIALLCFDRDVAAT